MIPFVIAITVCVVGWLLYWLWDFSCRAWVPVLCYHHVAEPERDDPGNLHVSPQLFNDQLGYLRKNGYSPVTLDQLYNHVAGSEQLPEKPVAVTFDDGYLDNWTYAFPMLCHYEVPATIFVVTSRIGEGPRRPTLDDVHEGVLTREALDQGHREAGEDDGASYLNWNELSKMRATGLVSMAGHSHTHLDLKRANRKTTLEELRLSRAMVQERECGECTDLAWPFGFHSRSAEHSARVAGFRSAYRVSTRLFGGRGNRPGANPMALRRLAVTADLDLEKALEFYHQPSIKARLRAVVDFIRYHMRKVGGGT